MAMAYKWDKGTFAPISPSSYTCINESRKRRTKPSVVWRSIQVIHCFNWPYVDSFNLQWFL